jgi:LmbE family N-acetylglucosaminyl deacetylase
MRNGRARNRCLCLALCMAATLAALPAWAQRVRSVRELADFSRILWIGAHPDDESLLAPLLGKRCVEMGSHCSLLAMTRGENGSCALPSGCGPDLGSLRVKELHAAAAKLNSGLETWELPDVMSDVLAKWDDSAGGHEALLGRLQKAIEAASPTIVMTFDPKHGSTCHPAHMAIADLVTQAAARLEHRPPVVFLETRVLAEGETYALYRGVASARTLMIFNVATGWNYLLDDLRTHASQFTPAQVASAELPAQERTIVLLPSDAQATAVYVDACP